MFQKIKSANTLVRKKRIQQGIINVFFVLILALNIIPSFSTDVIAAENSLTYADLNNWASQGPGIWNVEAGGRTVRQTLNDKSTFFVSPDNLIDQVITGTIKVDTTDDDDMIGFVLGYQEPVNNYYDFILFDWKQAAQSYATDWDGAGPGGSYSKTAYEGYTLGLATGTFVDQFYTGGFGDWSKYFWFHEEEEGRYESLGTNYGTGKGWIDKQEYQFKILYTQSQIKITIDDQVIFDVSGSFKSGKIGFYNESQANVEYGNVRLAPGTSSAAAPVAQADRYGMSKNTTLTIDKFDGVLANDYDPNLNTYTISLQSNVAHGSLTLNNTDGSFQYTPAADYVGLDSFTYQLTDTENMESQTVTVALSVIDGINSAPTAIALANNIVKLGSNNGTVIGALSTTDPNAGDFHDYMLVDNAGGRFGIVDNKIVVNDSSLISSAGSYNIKVRTTDFQGLYLEKVLAIEAINVAPVAGFGYNLDFDGIDDYVDMGDNPNLIVGSQFTEEAWIYPTETGDNEYHGFLGSQPAGGTNLRPPSLWSYQKKKVHGGFGDGTDWNSWISTNDVLIFDTWNHVAATFDGNTYALYVNGNLAFETTDYSGTEPFASPIRNIGRVDNYFKGGIDEVRVWNTALSQSTIQAWMNRDITSSHPQFNRLLGYWQFNHSEGTTAADSTGKGNDGALIGMSPADDWQPSTIPNRYYIEEGGSIPIYLIGYDENGDELSYIIAEEPTHGSLNGSGNERVYTHDGSETSADTITYRVSDGILTSANTAAIEIIILPVNDEPIVNNGTIAVLEDTAYTGVLSGYDVDGDLLTFSKVSDPGHGSVSVNSDSSFTYTPAENYNGSDSFTFKVNDGTADSAVGTVTVTVTAINDAPSFNIQPELRINKVSGPQSIPNWLSNLSVGPGNEVGEGQTISNIVASVDLPDLFKANATPAIAGDGTLTFEAKDNVKGTAIVSVTVKDNGGTANGGQDTSAPQTFTIYINTTAPVQPEITPSSTLWTNNDVTVTHNYPGDPPVKEYRIGDGTYQAYTVPIVLGSNQTVYARSQDADGNYSIEVSLTITNIDKDKPTGSIAINNGAAYTNTSAVTLNLTAADGGTGSGIAQMAFSNDGVTWTEWENYGVSKAYTLSSGNGQKTVFVRFRDQANNVSATSQASIILDSGEMNKVEFSALGNQDPAKAVEVTVTVTNNISGINENSLQYRWSTSASTPADGWAAFQNNGSITKSDGDGNWYLHIRASDNAGNPINGHAGPFALDNSGPQIVLQGNNPFDVEFGNGYTEPGYTALDDSDGDVTGEVVVTGTIDTATLGSYELAYNVSDSLGNPAQQVVRTVRVIDTIAPTITVNGEGSITLNVWDAYTDAGASATDTHDGDLSDKMTVSIIQNGNIVSSVDTSHVGSYTINYDVIDASGNSAHAERTVRVVYTGAPLITLNGDHPLALEVHSTYTEPGATAQDAYDGDLTADIEITGSIDQDQLGSYSIHYRVTNSQGISHEVIRTVNVIDTTKPELTLQGESLAVLNQGGSYTDQGVTASDNYDLDLSASVVVTITRDNTELPAVDTTALGYYIVHYNVSDSSGNQALEVVRTVAVTDVPDTTPPEILLAGGKIITLEVGASYNEPGATAEDNYDKDLSTSIQMSGAVNSNKIGSYTLTYSVSDNAGNLASVTRTIQVVDTSKPVLALNGNSTVGIPQNGTYADEGASATDTYDGDLTAAIQVNGQVNTATAGTYTLTYSVRDSSGNTATAVRFVYVHPQDTIAPILTLNGRDTLALEVGGSYEDPGAGAMDNLDGDLSERIIISGSVDPAQPGTYPITYTVRDNDGNTAMLTRTVHVVDTTQPVITLNGDSTITLVKGTAFIDTGVKATDNYDGDLSAQLTVTIARDNNPVAQVDTNIPGSYTIKYDVKDSAQNAADTAVRFINVIDVSDGKAPVIILNGPDNISVLKGGNYQDLGARAIDDVDGDLTSQLSVVNPVDANTVGNYTVTYTVIDQAGQTTTLTRTVHVLTPPTITLTGEKVVTVEAGQPYTEPGFSAKDYMGQDLTSQVNQSIINANGDGVDTVDTTSPGIYTLTYRVSDSYNNTVEAYRIVNVVNSAQAADSVSPIITLNGSKEQHILRGQNYSDLGATAWDNQDGDISDKVRIAGSVNTGNAGTYNLTYSVQDAAGNATNVSRTIYVDNPPPTINLNGAPNVFLETGSTNYADSVVSATDLDGNNLPVTNVIRKYNEATQSYEIVDQIDTGAPAMYEITYTVKDPRDQRVLAQAVRFVRVVDFSSDDIPFLSLNGRGELQVEVGTPYVDPGAQAFTRREGNISDRIQTVIEPMVPANVIDTSHEGSYIVKYSVTYSQEGGGEATIDEVRNVEVVDSTPPALTLTGDQLMNIPEGGAFSDPGATAIDIQDGGLSNNITKVGAVNTSTPGTYTIIYNVADSKGNQASVTRFVNVLADSTSPVITLQGSQTVTLNVDKNNPDKYQDIGAKAIDNLDGDISAKIVIDSSQVDTSKVGTYQVTYNVSDQAGNQALEVRRTVKVIDAEAPAVTLQGAKIINLIQGATYAEPGYTITDAYDGDLTSSEAVTVTIMYMGTNQVVAAIDTNATGNYKVTYTVHDSAGNPATAARFINVIDISDHTPPVITLNGQNPVIIEYGSVYMDPGATASDNVDGNLTAKMLTLGLEQIDTRNPGTYYVKYSVTDTAGNLAEVTRTVRVAAPDWTDDSDSIPAAPLDQTTVDDDLISMIVDKDLNNKLIGSGIINQELKAQIVSEVNQTIKQSLDELIAYPLETELNSAQGAAKIILGPTLSNLGKEVNLIIRNNTDNTLDPPDTADNYQLNLSIIEKETQQQVFSKSDINDEGEEIEVDKLKDYTSYIVKIDIIVDGQVIGSREKEILTLDRTAPVIHNVEISNGILEVDASDNVQLNPKPIMLYVQD